MPSVHHSIKKQKKRVYKEPNLYKLVFFLQMLLLPLQDIDFGCLVIVVSGYYLSKVKLPFTSFVLPSLNTTFR
jgi:hypothetical protein